MPPAPDDALPRPPRLIRPRDILLAIVLFGPLLGGMLVAGIFTVGVLNGVRASIAGEGNWSEGIQHAVFHLDRYAEHGDLRDFEQFRAGIHHPLALKRGRLELERSDPDLDLAGAELIDGGIHPDDAFVVIWLFRRLGHVGALQDAMSAWQASDEDLVHLVDLATTIRGAIERDGIEAAELPGLRADLIEMRARLRDHGMRFSQAMGGAARWAVGVGIGALVGAALLLFLLGTTVLLVALRRIRRSESALLETEERFRQITENIDEVFWIVSPDRATYHYLSPAFERMWGIPREQALADPATVLDRIHPDDRPRVERQMLEAGEYRIVRDDGEIRWLAFRSVPVRDARGHTFRIAGITEDITSRKEAEAERARAESRYQKLVASAPYSIFFLDGEGQLIDINPAGASMLGAPHAEIIGSPFAKFIAPDNLDRANAALHDLLTGARDALEIEIWIEDRSGERRLVEAVALADRADGAITGIWGIARDVTDLRENERHNRLLGTALANLREEGVAIIRGDGSYVYTNDAHAGIYGYPPGSPPGEGTQVIAPTEAMREEVRVAFSAAREEGGWSGRIWRRRLDDGRLIAVDVILAKMAEVSEDLFLSIVRDVTDQVRQERELRRAERLGGLARLVGGVAHELNNPLTSIKGFVELLLEASADAEMHADLEVVQREADRAAKIVQDLRLIAGKGRSPEAGSREVLDLGDIVRHVGRVRAYGMAAEGIDLRIDLPDGLVPVAADPGELEQVVLNLVQNAEDALTDVEGDRRIEIEGEIVGDHARLAIRDTGTGIPEHLHEALFDPFWTTKESGTGLGLSIVRGIVEDLAGTIELRSRAGGPTEFALRLPLADASEASEAAPAPDPSTPLRILIVDDEDAIRASVRRHLERRGHQVEEARNGLEALEQINSAGARLRFDAIVTDLRMPEMGGRKLFDRIVVDHPDAVERMIFMTGDAVSEQAASLLETLRAPIVFKPFEMTEITEVIERVGGTRAEV